MISLENACSADIDAALLCAFQRDFETALGHAGRAIDASARVGLAYRQAVATLIHEWAGVEGRGLAPDLEKLSMGLGVFRQVGAMIGYGFYLALAAEAHARAGDHDRSDELIGEALRTCGRSRGFFYEGELHRLNGDLKLARLGSQSSAEAESCYRRALDITGSQGARLFELRAANSLARLWLDQGERARARDLLAPVCDRFTEGLDTPDIRNAKALLDELG